MLHEREIIITIFVNECNGNNVLCYTNHTELLLTTLSLNVIMLYLNLQHSKETSRVQMSNRLGLQLVRYLQMTTVCVCV